jgi:hypothetical protein
MSTVNHHESLKISNGLIYIQGYKDGEPSSKQDKKFILRVFFFTVRLNMA